MCWYCTWGIPIKAAEVYLDAIDKLRGDTDPLRYGPAHAIWDDYNFDYHSIKSCLNNFSTYANYSDFSDSELRVVRWSLMKLLQIPENELDIEPDIDDNELGENYPPSILTVNVDSIVYKWHKERRWG